jgi:SAM-dependent methyltransferase
MLSRRFAVVGVDISQQMVRLARLNAPRAVLLQADMASVAFRPASFDGVVAFYSLIHVPRVHHAGLLARVRRWLRPGGVLVASLGWHDLPVGTDPDWLGGGPMHWNFFDARPTFGCSARLAWRSRRPGSSHRWRTRWRSRSCGSWPTSPPATTNEGAV